MYDQNVYDDEKFFNGYYALRQTKDNYNVLIEQPAMSKLICAVKDKCVLDLGCGFGDNCAQFARMGAKRVVGIDISEKMLSVAKKENSHKTVQYVHSRFENIDTLNEKFDLVYSSLAFHYTDEFDVLMKKIYAVMNEGATLLFSQEHPIATATIDGNGHYNYDGDEPVSYTFSHYNKSGKRTVEWFVKGVQKYHRTFAQVINAVAQAGLTVTQVVEPTPDERALSIRPSLRKEFIKPSFLIVKAVKK